MLHSPEKCKRGTLCDLLTYMQLQNIKKKSKRDPFETLKKFGKSRTVPKKSKRGDPLVSSGFVGYLKKIKMKGGGILCTKFALAGLGTGP